MIAYCALFNVSDIAKHVKSRINGTVHQYYLKRSNQIRVLRCRRTTLSNSCFNMFKSTESFNKYSKCTSFRPSVDCKSMHTVLDIESLDCTVGLLSKHPTKSLHNASNPQQNTVKMHPAPYASNNADMSYNVIRS